MSSAPVSQLPRDDNKLGRRVGVIGTGFMGSVHLAAWRGLGITPAVILTRSESPPPKDLSLAGIEMTSDVDTFLDLVDVVDICTPSDTHEELALVAARAGKPTICEKPLALGVAASLRVIDAFEQADVPFQVAHVVRFFPEYAAARAAVMSGQIGEPAVVRLSRVSFAPDRAADSWFADERRSGGLFFDLMIHDLDYARWIAGDVTSVYARASGGSRSHGIAILTHATGTISHIEASWAAPAPVFRTQLEVAGSRGLLQFDSEETAPIKPKLHLDTASATTGLSEIDLAVNPFEAELQHFLDVLDGGREPVLTPYDGAAAVQVAAAATTSARDGVAVSVGPLRGEV